MPLPKDIRFVTLRLLRHPDRLGDRRLRRIPEGGRPRRLHDRPRRADPALPRHPARDPERLLRALRRGPAPDRRARAPRSSAGTSSRRARSFLPDSVPRWPPFRETNAQLERFAKKFEIGHPLEHRRQAARRHAPPLPRRLRPGRHRPAGALVQAGPGPLQGVRAPDRRQEGLGPHRVGLRDRRRALPQGEDPGDLGQPPRREARVGQKKPTEEVKTLRDAAQAARRPPERLARRRRPPGRARRDEPLLADERDRAARRRARRC